MQVNLSLTPGYRLKISRVSRMSELVDRAITSLARFARLARYGHASRTLDQPLS